jgi:hypothetical protein
VGAFPNHSSIAEGFQASCKVASSVSSSARLDPGWKSGGEEEGIGEPSILKTKTLGTGDGGGCSDEKGDVIRCGAGERSEGGIGEGKVPSLVKECSIKTSKDRRGTFIGPGVKTIEQGELKEGEVPD